MRVRFLASLREERKNISCYKETLDSHINWQACDENDIKQVYYNNVTYRKDLFDFFWTTRCDIPCDNKNKIHCRHRNVVKLFLVVYSFYILNKLLLQKTLKFNIFSLICFRSLYCFGYIYRLFLLLLHSME